MKAIYFLVENNKATIIGCNTTSLFLRNTFGSETWYTELPSGIYDISDCGLHIQCDTHTPGMMELVLINQNIKPYFKIS